MKHLQIACFLFSIFITNLSYASVVSDLQKYGNAVSVSTDGTVKFVSAEQTTSPMKAFKLIFKTDHEALMSVAGAASGTAYYTNIARREAWSMKFRTKELKKIMLRHKIDLVTGFLTNLVGETQSIAFCFQK